MKLFIGLGWFSLYLHRKPKLCPLYNKLASGIPASGHFHRQLQESAKCYRLNVKTVTPGIYVSCIIGTSTTLSNIS